MEGKIPNPTSFIVHLPRRGLSDDAVVVNIIDKDIRRWNVLLIKEVFVEGEAEESVTLLLALLVVRINIFGDA